MAMGISESAAEQLRKTAADLGLGDDWYLRVYVDEPTDGFDAAGWLFRFEFEMKPARHILTESNGVKLIIARAQADLFAGLFVSRNQENTGFFVKKD
jgi:hypothetical protein